LSASSRNCSTSKYGTMEAKLAQSSTIAARICTHVWAHICPRKCRPYNCLHKWHERKQLEPAKALQAPSDAKAMKTNAKMMLHFMPMLLLTKSFPVVNCHAEEVVGPLPLGGSLFPRPLLRPTKATMMTRTGKHNSYARSCPRPRRVGKPVKGSSSRALSAVKSMLLVISSILPMTLASSFRTLLYD